MLRHNFKLLDNYHHHVHFTGLFFTIAYPLRLSYGILSATSQNIAWDSRFSNPQQANVITGCVLNHR